MVTEEKKKRPPNKWQLFLSNCFSTQDKGLPMTEKVSACGIQYRELKEKDPKKLEEIIALVKSKREPK
jgi:hypothetical protein